MTEWSLDGTFDRIPVPKIWTQLFTVHAFSGEKLVHLVYRLLARKTTATYTEVFRQIKDRARQLNIVVAPTMLRCDFESGLIPALRQYIMKWKNKYCQNAQQRCKK